MANGNPTSTKVLDMLPSLSSLILKKSGSLSRKIDYALTYVVNSIIMHGTKGIARRFQGETPSFTGIQQIFLTFISTKKSSFISSPCSLKAYLTSRSSSVSIKVVVRSCLPFPNKRSVILLSSSA